MYNEPEEVTVEKTEEIISIQNPELNLKRGREAKFHIQG
jgi:hypothetical protein